MSVISRKFFSNMSFLRKKFLDFFSEISNKVSDIRKNLSDPLLTNMSIGLKYYYNGRYTDAIIRFTIIRFLWKKNLESLVYLGSSYAKKGKISKAKKNLEAAASMGSNKAIYFLKKIDCPEKVISVPLEITKESFDYLANVYAAAGIVDNKLYDSLLVRINNIVRKRNNIGIFNFLDLGCGAGNVGVGLSALSIKKSVVGVDVSSNMTSFASKASVDGKNLYDSVHNVEMHEFLSKEKENFDFIIALKAFEYYGDLRVIIELCRRRLSESGCVIFISPKSTSDSIQFIPDLDLFCYSEPYIRDVFKLLGVEKYDLRTISLTKDIDYLECVFYK